MEKKIFPVYRKKKLIYLFLASDRLQLRIEHEYLTIQYQFKEGGKQWNV